MLLEQLEHQICIFTSLYFGAAQIVGIDGIARYAGGVEVELVGTELGHPRTAVQG